MQVGEHRARELRARPRGTTLDATTPYRGIITPPPPPAPPPLDPTEGWLDSPVGRVVEARAGDVCSLLGIAGAAVLVLNHRGLKSPRFEMVGERIVMGSMAAAGVDALIQARNVIKDDGEGAKRRGNPKSSWGTVAYAATGLIPAASLRSLRGLHRAPSTHEIFGLGALGVNAAMLGYETVHRVPKMVRGEEDASGYGSFLASLGGFVAARRSMGRG
ncbi:MAG: hypothetical protein JWL76_727 [Thermoleophilia bacterium]|nr:hypothetical protein [Thermoleophilia bacterium]